MSDIFEMPVFAAANVFPMLTEDELNELAVDITDNGLREPLVIAEIESEDGEKTMMLIDGRNRRAACEIANVEPDTRTLNGEDPKAFVMSANIHRRHLSKGQRAMVTAMIYPDSEQGKRTTSVKNTEVSDSYLSKARIVLKHTPDAAQTVVSGAVKLADAYDAAIETRDKEATKDDSLQQLRARDAELADKVVEGDLSLDEAKAVCDVREKQARAARAPVLELLKPFRHLAAGLGNTELTVYAAQTAADFPDELKANSGHDINELLAYARTLAGNLPRFIEAIEAIQKGKANESDQNAV
jgi:hypothetical protein